MPALLCAFAALPAAAQDVTAPVTSSAKRAAEARPDEWQFVWREHPSLRFGDIVRIDFRARVQGDLRATDYPTHADFSSFDLARRRIGAEGSLGDRLDFQIERELASDSPWRDVYVDARAMPHLQVQAGRFKLPFGLDENTSSGALDFVYRSRVATDLSPGRDRGVMAHGRAAIVRYEIGLFAHDGDNARDDAGTVTFGDRTTAARLLLEPFRSSKSPLEDFQIGAALTASDVPAGRSGVRGQTAFGETFFPRAFEVQGERRRIGVETRWRPGPFSLQAEYARLTSERIGQSVEDTDLPPIVGEAWYVSGAWILTGERKRRGALEPRRALFDGGMGLVEVAGRVERLRYSSNGDLPASTAPRSATLAPFIDNAVTVGVNWSPNRWTRVQFNIIRDDVTTPAASSASRAWSRVLRFQFSL